MKCHKTARSLRHASLSTVTVTGLDGSPGTRVETVAAVWRHRPRSTLALRQPDDDCEQDAAPTYKRRFGFHPLGVWCDDTGEALAAMLRPGNAEANNAAAEFPHFRGHLD